MAMIFQDLDYGSDVEKCQTEGFDLQKFHSD